MYLDLIFDFWCFNVTFKHNINAILWRAVFIGGGSRSALRKPPTSDRKTDNSSQLRLKSGAPARTGFEHKTSVLTG